MRSLLLLSRHSIAPGLLALLLLVALPACSTTEEATNDAGDMAEEAVEETGDAADEAAEAAGEAAEEVGDVAEGAWDVVTDAAGSAWDSTTDLFDDDPELDAAALVRPASGSSAEGTVRFYEMGDELRVAVSLRGLDPGMHGIHIHQNASCANDAQAAGGHWDPMSTNNHGAPTDDMSDKHLGDLGNIDIAADGTVESTFTVPNFPADEYDVAGHALVLHGGQDDLETDPAGDAGTRVGCGIIEGR